MKKVVVKGAAMTAFGEWWERGVEDMTVEVVKKALAEAGRGLEEMDLLVVGNMLLPHLEGQSHVGAYVATALGYRGASLAVEAACASGGVAMSQALAALWSGQAQRVLVVGVEKMSDVSSETVAQALMGAAAREERWVGMTFPSLYGMMQRAYMERYRVSEEIMASIPVKNHHHGSLNHLAHFQNSITTETVLASGMVAEPIRLLHCSPISDGAAAVVLEMSEVVKSGEVEVVGLGVGGDTIGLSGRRSLTSLLATKTATQRAMKMSGLTIDQIEVAELHDCFSVAEAMALEDVGLVPEGRAAAMVADGYGRVGSDGVVINSSGGLKACGHPVGATGVKQVVEIVWQLTGRVGKRQKNNARVGLTHNVGGTGATAVVQIFRRAD